MRTPAPPLLAATVIHRQEQQQYIKVSWWVPVYLRTLSFFCITFGTEPDWAKVKATCLRGVRLVTKS